MQCCEVPQRVWGRLASRVPQRVGGRLAGQWGGTEGCLPPATCCQGLGGRGWRSRLLCTPRGTAIPPHCLPQFPLPQRWGAGVSWGGAPEPPFVGRGGGVSAPPNPCSLSWGAGPRPHRPPRALCRAPPDPPCPPAPSPPLARGGRRLLGQCRGGAGRWGPGLGWQTASGHRAQECAAGSQAARAQRLMQLVPVARSRQRGGRAGGPRGEGAV